MGERLARGKRIAGEGGEEHLGRQAPLVAVRLVHALWSAWVSSLWSSDRAGAGPVTLMRQAKTKHYRETAVRSSFFASAPIAALWFLLAGCGGSEDEPRWTVPQAESITSVRGLTVRVRDCRGLGEGRRDDGTIRFKRFRCLAGGRAVNDPYDFDTVGVTLVLHPQDEYAGPRSPYRLTNVRFIGGPGIP